MTKENELEEILRGALYLLMAGEKPMMVTSVKERVFVCAVRCQSDDEVEQLKRQFRALMNSNALVAHKADTTKPLTALPI